MGCDIHAYLERRYDGSTDWRLIVLPPDKRGDVITKWDFDLNLGRNYKLFAELSNVRGQALADTWATYGLPATADPLVKCLWQQDEPDGHTPGHILLDKFLNLCVEIDYTNFKVYEALKELQSQYFTYTHRIVFWYDS